MQPFDRIKSQFPNILKQGAKRRTTEKLWNITSLWLQITKLFLCKFMRNFFLKIPSGEINSEGERLIYDFSYGHKYCLA